MAQTNAKIEDYAMMGDFRTCALVSSEGSIDWMCAPRFDSGACFAKLLGNEDNGFWSIKPQAQFKSKRKYRENTLIIETDFETSSGAVRITDCMLLQCSTPTILRIVKGISGSVKMKMEFVVRFDYGSVVPWVTRSTFGGIKAVAGPDAVRLKTTAEMHGVDMRTESEFEVAEGEAVPFQMSWTISHDQAPPEITEPESEVEKLTIWWQDWARQCDYHGPYAETVRRSLITVKGLTFASTGGIVAAPTTSLPEQIGGERNWDYRYCWIRDSTITLRALLQSGYREEALSWRDWLMRAVAGKPEQISIMYGIGGERRLTELELPWLKGYENSKPVRIGNAAFEQFQLDVFGNLIGSFHLGREHGLNYQGATWQVEKKIIDFLITVWQKPDRGIWEVRGPERHFVHSKAMCWVAMDRAAKAITDYGCPGPAEEWAKVAREIHADVLKNGFNEKIGSYVQSYGASNLDASLLLLPVIGFLPATDPRMAATIDLIEQRLSKNGLIMRYANDETEDGLSGSEGAFLPCSLWLAICRAKQGRMTEAKAIFERVQALQNDVGLFSEEYDPVAKRFLGNFPQAFTHVAIINCAHALAEAEKEIEAK